MMPGGVQGNGELERCEGLRGVRDRGEGLVFDAVTQKVL